MGNLGMTEILLIAGILLIFFPMIMYLVLGFGSSEYHAVNA